MSDEEKKEFVKKKSEFVSIKPLKDFVLNFNEYKYDMKKGKEIKIHKKFLQNLKTEKVIK